MWSSAKLGTRVVAGAIDRRNACARRRKRHHRCSGAARVTPFTGRGRTRLRAATAAPAIRADLASPAGVAVDAAGDSRSPTPATAAFAYVPSTAGVHFGIAMRRARHLHDCGLDVRVVARRRAGHGRGALVPFRRRVRRGRAMSSSPTPATTRSGWSRRTARSRPSPETGRPALAGDGRPATDAELDARPGIAVDDAREFFIADTNNCRVREVAGRHGTSLRRGAMAPGDIYTVAGNGTCGHSGDGGPATSAELFTPAGVAVDAHGDLLDRRHRATARTRSRRRSPGPTSGSR